MSKQGRRASSRAGFTAVLAGALLCAPPAHAGKAQTAAPLALTGWDASAVDRARSGALRRLERAECRKLFTDFKDAQGRTLQQNLEDWGASPSEYLGIIPFVDGTRQKLCRQTKNALVAQPGIRRVFVCKAFADYSLKQPGIAESMVIHEILHTLGLGENPPSSIEITQRVEARCR